MPPKSRKKKTKISGGEGGISTIKNFTSTRSPSPVMLTAATVAPTVPVKSFFTPKPNSTSRLLTVPAAAATAASAAATASAASTLIKPNGKSSILRYFIIFIILAILALLLGLYLQKPANESILHIFDPITKFFNKDDKPKPAAIDTIQKTREDKRVVNNIGAANAAAASRPKHKKYKKKPVVIPEADDATSKLQMKPKSKAGFCYIGEDRGFRSCIEVGDGDVCMSGDIFPTEAICINPNLRE